MTNRPTASLVAALRSYRAMPGSRNRCTRSQAVAADLAFAAIVAEAARQGVQVWQVGSALDR